MSFLDATSFTFDGKSSELFNLIICWIDSTPELETNGLVRTPQRGELNNVRLSANYYGMKHENNIEFSFCIMKNYCNGDTDYFSREESMAINNWLISSSVPKLLRFNDNDIPSLHYYAVCTSIKDIYINNHNAKEIHFETNSPFGFMYPIEKSFLVSGEEQFNIENLSDTIDGIYYPSIDITTESADDVIIENISDQKSVTINLSEIQSSEDGKKIIHIDCKKMIITDSKYDLVSLYKIGWNNDYKSIVSSANDIIINYIYWPRLLSGKNEMKITGNCIITFKCEFPRRVGCL